jgi:hypothetical protein
VSMTKNPCTSYGSKVSLMIIAAMVGSDLTSVSAMVIVISLSYSLWIVRQTAILTYITSDWAREGYISFFSFDNNLLYLKDTASH